DVCRKASSNVAQKDLQDNNGKYPIYGAGGLIKHVDFYHREAEYIAIVKDGAGIGRAMLLPAYSSVIGTMQYILPNEKIDIKYLYYAIVHMNLAKYFSGATIPHIYFKDYQKETLNLPEITEQRKIACIFEKIDRVIDCHKSQLAKLEQLVKSRFIELFGDPVSNPHGYAKVPLSELAEIKIGPFGSLLHKEDYITNGHALVNPSHIVAGKLSIDDQLTVSDEKFSELSAYHLQIGDVVMGRRGEMGRCAVVETDGLLCGTGSLLIRTKGGVTADYLQKIISFPSFKKTIEDMAVGQTMPNLNVPIVSGFQIIKPPIEVQKAYYTFVEQTDKSKSAVQASLEKLETLKKSLMQQYFG
ncbi:MAG: restriction endonuclease subunit S, partial [Acutalibacteraceae bacterium]